MNLPDVEDEAGLRSWLTKLSDFASWVVAQTPGTVDDTLAAAFAKCLASDDAWSILYSLIISFWPADNLVAARELPTDPRITKLAEVLGFDPASLIALIEAIIGFLRSLFAGKTAGDAA
jgi:hypothetical protein